MATRAIKAVGGTVEDALNVLDADETWRPALIAFYRGESPWMTTKVARLKAGCEFSIDDRHVIDGLKAASQA